MRPGIDDTGRNYLPALGFVSHEQVFDFRFVDEYRLIGLRHVPFGQFPNDRDWCRALTAAWGTKAKNRRSGRKMNDAVFVARKASGSLTIGDKKEIDKATWRKPRGIRLTPTSRYVRDMLFQISHRYWKHRQRPLRCGGSPVERACLLQAKSSPEPLHVFLVVGEQVL